MRGWDDGNKPNLVRTIFGWEGKKKTALQQLIHGVVNDNGPNWKRNSVKTKRTKKKEIEKKREKPSNLSASVRSLNRNAEPGKQKITLNLKDKKKRPINNEEGSLNIKKKKKKKGKTR